MADLTIQWKDADGSWKPFDVADIINQPVQHAVYLFSNPVPVVAKDGGCYVVNSEKLRDDYKRARKKVVMFSDLEPERMGRPLGSVGFVGRLA